MPEKSIIERKEIKKDQYGDSFNFRKSQESQVNIKFDELIELKTKGNRDQLWRRASKTNNIIQLKKEAEKINYISALSKRQ